MLPPNVPTKQMPSLPSWRLSRLPISLSVVTSMTHRFRTLVINCEDDLMMRMPIVATGRASVTTAMGCTTASTTCFTHLNLRHITALWTIPLRSLTTTLSSVSWLSDKNRKLRSCHSEHSEESRKLEGDSSLTSRGTKPRLEIYTMDFEHISGLFQFKLFALDDFQSLHHRLVGGVVYFIELAHPPKVAGYECLQLHFDEGERCLV